MMPIPKSISIRHAHLAFNDSMLFKDLNLTLQAGQWTCLLGPSGVGKTSLLRLIAGLATPNTLISGEIIYDPPSASPHQAAYMGQTDMLLPWLSVLNNVLLGSRLRGENINVGRTKRSVSANLNIEKAKSLLNEVGLSTALNLYPRELSGGMRQRVALVRTLMEDQTLVLMDEPFSALDTITRYKLQNLAAKLLKNRTVFFITHDPLEALRLADEIYVMSGSPAKLSEPLRLTAETPRDPGNPEVLLLQAKLLHALTEAQEWNV